MKLLERQDKKEKKESDLAGRSTNTSI